MMNPVDLEFWVGLEELISSSRLVVDRPRNSAHPRYPEVIYPLDYGFLEGTTTIDGGGIDFWHGSGSGNHLTGLALSVDLRKRDAELKLLLDCSTEDVQIVLDFLNGDQMRAVYIQRP